MADLTLCFIVISRILTGILTYGEERDGLCLVRKNSDHWREPVPTISPVGNAGKKTFVREVGRILKAVLDAVLASHATYNFLGQVYIWIF